MANFSKGKIAIPNVTGNIVINIQAVQSAPPYTNLVPLSIDDDGNVFNETGYQNDKRFDSSGAVSDLTGSTITGFIPFEIGDTLRIGGASWNRDDTSLSTAIMAYNSDKVLLGNKDGKILNQYGKLDKVDGIYVYTLGNATEVISGTGGYSKITNNSTAYIRVSAIANGANLIVTKNEPIM